MPDETTNIPPSNNDQNIVFEIPSTAVSEPTLSETTNIEFEKYKMKMNFNWLGFFCFFVKRV